MLLPILGNKKDSCKNISLEKDQFVNITSSP